VNSHYFLEVLARNGEVKHRQRVDTLPIRIGRSYDNDFILDDRHTSPHHAVVERTGDGGLEVRDLGSRNGVFLKGRRQIQMPIDGNTIFRLGHTNLRVRSMDFPVADEMADTTLHSWEGWPPALTGLVLLVLMTLVSVWISDTEKSEPIRYFTALAGMLSVGLLWCGSWAMANRLFEGQTRFGRHLFIAACGLIVSEVMSLLISVTAYAFSLETLTRYDNHVAIAIVAGMVYFHLLTINQSHTRRFALISVLVSLLGSGVALIVNFQTSGHLAGELYMSELLSPKLRLSSDKPVAQFLDEAAQLKAKVDAERSKEVSLDGEDGEHQD
jgi:pSer/pThr/pTyr-binding forkhead associated (FHA) protein